METMSTQPEHVGDNTSSTTPRSPDSNQAAGTAATAAAPDPAPQETKQQWGLGVIYLTALLSCFGMALHWSSSSLKIALAWVAAGIIASQIVVDLGKFSSPEAKANFSVVFRSIAGIIALLAAYWL
jgi:hypothetical protein